MQLLTANYRLPSCYARVALLTAGLLLSVALGQSLPTESRTGTQAATSTAPTSRAATPQVPISFARSGQKLGVWLAAGKGVDFPKVVLRAFGRVWTEPVGALPMGGHPGFSAKVNVPTVRVPTVFSVTPEDSPDIEIGQLVAYPDHDVEWDKKITLYYCASPRSFNPPRWFDQWAAATGLPVKRMTAADLPSAKLAPADEKGMSLLILAQAGAKENLADVAKFASDKKVNVLVLDADWFGDTAGPVDVTPTQMLGGLSEMAKQHWAQPLKFASHRKPWSGIANRCAWIGDDSGLPMVEEPFVGWSKERVGQAVLLSYLPWEQRLGRDESADATLLVILTAAAKASVPDVFAAHHGVIVTGRPAELLLERSMALRPPGSRPFKVMADRPVLSAVVSTDTIIDDGPEQLDILDIRGKQAITDEMRQFVEKPAIRGDRRHVLILGDNKMLDEWEWVKLDRAKKTVNRPGVVWLNDVELPSSKDAQIRLMLKLTELGVPLAPPEKEKGVDKS